MDLIRRSFQTATERRSDVGGFRVGVLRSFGQN
jgi:hypothetical protein